jgi:prepilin peptidase CpaA
MHWNWWAIFSVLAIATAFDVFSRRIPNWLVLPFLAAGLVISAINRGIPGLESSLAGIALAALLMGPLCVLRSMGMGDLKLCAGIGAWIGPGPLFFALVIAAIAGGFLAVGYAAYHRSLGSSLDGTGDLIAGIFRGKIRRNRPLSLDRPGALSIPYAPAIAIGTVLAFLASHG